MLSRLLVICYLLLSVNAFAESGYDLWMRYQPISQKKLQLQYAQAVQHISIRGDGATVTTIKNELGIAVKKMLGIVPVYNNNKNSGLIFEKSVQSKYGPEGYALLSTSGTAVRIIAGTDAGWLYGMYHVLRLMQTERSLENLNIQSAPKVKLRLLNHWDNLNRTVERGYAGFSIWDWHTLPDYIDQRYIDYARANASIGINGTVLTNVNANAQVLTPAYLKKVKALADVFRPYNIKVYLTARFSAPMEIGGLKTADPLDENVKKWWKNKAAEIYALIPDFGGLLVKANSEGQPGPQDYHRTHADGANMLADAVAPYNGIVMWRAFVYSNEVPDDRHKQAYNEFVPLDGTFRDNVMVQVKNGAIDFMPREPFHPLFGAMPATPLMMEFQLTQEYLGQGTHLAYLAPLFKEVLNSDTYYKGKGSTVARIIDGSLDKHALTGIAGVANIGSDLNWTGHPFAQANWYALGRLCWNYEESSEAIAADWIRMTFNNDAAFVKDIQQIMMQSREILVSYMNPLGLHHIMATGHHYGPGPWVNNLGRIDWNPTYYHRADSAGIGFDRTKSGSNALSQYKPEAQQRWENVAACEEKNLLWFHHVPWDYKMSNGNTLWDELCRKYDAGADSARWMQQQWDRQRVKVDAQRFRQVQMLLSIQAREAQWWRDACILYFQQFSGKPIPATLQQPAATLQYYQSLSFPNAPGHW